MNNNEELFKAIQDVALEYKLVDTITKVYPQPDEGTPQFVEGLWKGRPVKYEIWYEWDEWQYASCPLKS